jgi:hypothetical protein
LPDHTIDFEAWREWPQPPSNCIERANAAETWRDWRVDTNECRAAATEKVIAFMLTWRSQYDSWYLAYAYEYGGRVYHFAWETPYDELHRGFGHTGPAAWYDGMGEGQPFGVLVDPSEPWRHWIATPPFDAMNGSIAVLDR